MVEALVVGTGIGGLAAALALRRNGLGVRIFERATDLGRPPTAAVRADTAPSRGPATG